MTVEARMSIKMARTVWTMRRPRIRSKEKEGVGDMAVVAVVAAFVKTSGLACPVTRLCLLG